MGLTSYKTELLRIAALVATTLCVVSGAGRAQDISGAEHVVMLLELKRAETLKKEGKHLACGQAYLNIYKKNPDATDVDDILLNAAVCFKQGKQVELAIVLHRKRAENLEKEDKHIACGQAYLDIYKNNPDAADMDYVVYNAGVCFENGKLVGAALRMYDLLDKRFPNSKHNKRVLLRMGNIHGSTANYQQAAEVYERYARRFGGEKDAPYALQNATTYRKAIGHDKEAIANIESFVKKYRRKLKYETSAAYFGLAGIYERQGNRDMVVKTYKRYLKEIGRSGGMDRMLIANAKVGEILWKQSCKGPTHDGVCIKRERVVAGRRKAKKSAIPTQCGPASKVKLAVLARDPRLVKEATKYFKWAMKMATKRAIENAPDPGRKAAATYWMAASRFYLNEPKFEKFLTIEFPAKLNFSGGTAKQEKTKLESTKRFGQWLADKSKLAGVINNEYTQIRNITGGGAEWAIAAAARLAQVQQRFADAFWTAEIPRTVRRGPDAAAKIKQHCAVITADTASLEESSVRAYGFCLELSHRLNWPNGWSLMCANQLGEIRPADYPRANEVHGRSNGVSDILTTEDFLRQADR